MTKNAWLSPDGERLSSILTPFSAPSRLSRKASRPLLRRQAESCFSEIPQHTVDSSSPLTSTTKPSFGKRQEPSGPIPAPRFRSISWSSRSFRKSNKLLKQDHPLLVGGIDYRPGSRDPDEELSQCHRDSSGFVSQNNPAALVNKQGRTENISLSPSGSIKLRRSSKEDKSSESDARSSIGTATDSNYLRESDVSDIASHRPDTRSSYADSLAAKSSNGITIPVNEPYMNAPSRSSRLFETVAPNRRKKTAPHVIEVRRDDHKRSSSCSPALSSSKDPRTPTLAPDAVHQMLSRFVDDDMHSQHSPVGVAKMTQWLDKITADRQSCHSTFDNAKTKDLRKNEGSSEAPEADVEVMHFENFEFSTDTYEDTTPSYNVHQASDPHPLSTEPSDDDVTPLNQPIHNFTPNRISSLGFATKSRSISNPASLSAATVAAVRTASPTSEITVSAETSTLLQKAEDCAGVPRTPRRKNLSVQVPKNLALVDQLYKPERSPAVSDLHFATCFGVEQPFHKQSVQIGGQSLDFPLTSNSSRATLPLAADTDVSSTATLATPSWKPHIKRQQSMPVIMYRAAAPISPPPSGPLPAIPDRTSLSNQYLSPGHKRGRSVSPRLSSTKTEEPRHTRSTTIDYLSRTSVSPLASNPPTPTEIRYARRLSSVPTASKTYCRQPSQKHASTTASASAIAAVAAQLQKMTSTLPTPSPTMSPGMGPTTPV